MTTDPTDRPGLEITPHLEPGERVVALMQADLDERLHYSNSLLVITGSRLLALSPSGELQAWPLCTDHQLAAREHGGVGKLEWLGHDQRLGCWRYTLRQASDAHRLARAFDDWVRDKTGQDDPAFSACRTCGAPIESADAPCAACESRKHRAHEEPKSWAERARKSVLLRLLRFAKPRSGPIILGFALTIAATFAGLIWPYLTMPLMDDVLIPRQAGKPADFHLVWWYLGGMAASALLAWVLSWAKTYVLSWVSERIAADLRNETYAHLQRLSLEYFGGKRTGDLMSRLSTDTDRICNFLSINVLDYATDILMILATVAILVLIDPLLAVITLLPFPLIFWLVAQVRDRLLRGFHRGSRAWSHMTSVLADTIPGIRVVKAFAQEQREVDRFRRANDVVLEANDRVNQDYSFLGPTIALLTQAGLLIVWAFGSWRVFDRAIDVGVLTAFLTYISRFYTRIESMCRMVQATQRTVASSQRLFEILDRRPSVADPANPISTDRIKGAIELREVGFRYGTRRILQDINLIIEPGEMIGLVGPSGAGKSTLVNLVCRFYDVAEGAILIDDIDVRRFAVSDYHRHIGVVLQEPFLFFGTVAENIAYGRPDATRAEIIAAARAARAHEFILKLGDGYDSLVGERGQALSGGERQRISIARALLIDPRILILDEATSSVDTETEREIQEALDNLIRGRTTIAIAHRLSTLRKADRLVVLENGRIAEVGPHGDLLQNPDGAYSRLHRAQLELVGID